MRGFAHVGRWICATVLVAVVVFSTANRVSTYRRTQEVSAVLAGLGKVQLDKTTEAELVRLVPALAKGEVRIRNEMDYRWTRWLPPFADVLWPQTMRFEPQPTKYEAMVWPVRVMYWLGWRRLDFRASAAVRNGVVVGVRYALVPDVLVYSDPDILIEAQRVHRSINTVVQGVDDESPDFRLSAMLPEMMRTWHTPAAPQELVEQLYHPDLQCFWGLRGCDSPAQLVPRIWERHLEVQKAALTRIQSKDPCPDTMLAGRVRTISGINVALLEVVKAKTTDHVADYRLVEALRGQPKGPWNDLGFRSRVPWLEAPGGSLSNTVQPEVKPGDRFSGREFLSCSMVPWTPSAEAAIRSAIPLPEDKADWQ